jgi:hypothetical protein
MTNLVKAILAALVLAVFAGPASALPKIGEVMDYERYGLIFFQVGPVEAGPMAKKILRNEDNPVRRAKIAKREKKGIRGPYKTRNPEALHDDIRTALKERLIGLSKKACTFDMVIKDVDATRFQETVVLGPQRDFRGKVLSPQSMGGRSVKYSSVHISDQMFLVLPIEKGVWGSNPTVEFTSRDCQIKNPGSDGQSVLFHTAHRTSRGKPSTGMRMYLLVE